MCVPLETQTGLNKEKSSAIKDQNYHNKDRGGEKEERRNDNWGIGGKGVMANTVKVGPEMGASWGKFEGMDLVMEESIGSRKWKRTSRKGEGMEKKEKQVSGQRRKEREEDSHAHEDVIDTRKK